MSESVNDPVYGPQVKRPLRVKVLQGASLILALAGLVLLYLYSTHRDIPILRVADITPTMNFAYVRVVGEVTRDAYVFDSGGVVFNLDDGSGEIAVMGGRSQAEALKKDGKLPRRGDQVDVAGSLSVSADQESKLRMQSAEQLILIRKRAARSAAPASTRIQLSDITPAQKGRQFTVAGTLTSISVPSPGSKAPYVLILEEDGTELAVIFWDQVFQGLERKLPTLGNRISARGRVDVYHETVQLKVWEAGDLREISEQDLLDKVPFLGGMAEGQGGLSQISDITAEQKDQSFTVVGTLGEPRFIRGGVIYPLTDGSGEILVLFWDKQISGEEHAALESGIRLRVTAPLEVYKGMLELIPQDAGAFHVEAGE